MTKKTVFWSLAVFVALFSIASMVPQAVFGSPAEIIICAEKPAADPAAKPPADTNTKQPADPNAKPPAAEEDDGGCKC